MVMLTLITNNNIGAKKMNALVKPLYEISLEQQIEAFREIEQEFKTKKADYEKAKAAVIEAMGGLTEFRNAKGNIIATLTVSNFLSFNSTAFKADHKDIYELYKNKPESRTTFTLK